MISFTYKNNEVEIRKKFKNTSTINLRLRSRFWKNIILSVENSKLRYSYVSNPNQNCVKLNSKTWQKATNTALARMLNANITLLQDVMFIVSISLSSLQAGYKITLTPPRFQI